MVVWTANTSAVSGTYDEAKLMANYEKDPMFCVIDSAMRFLFYALSRDI